MRTTEAYPAGSLSWSSHRTQVGSISMSMLPTVLFLSIFSLIQVLYGQMVEDVLVMRSPGEILVSQSDFLRSDDVLPYSPKLGGSWSDYDLDISAGSPIQFSPLQGIIIEGATQTSTKIFSVLLGKTLKVRNLIVINPEMMTIVNLFKGEGIPYKVTPADLLELDVCQSNGTNVADPPCWFDTGSFNFITILNRVIFICDVVQGTKANGTIWLTTWSIDLEMPPSGAISSAKKMLREERFPACTMSRNLLVSNADLTRYENYFVMRYCYNQTEEVDQEPSEIQVIPVLQVAYEEATKTVIRAFGKTQLVRFLSFINKPTSTQFHLVQIIVMQQVAIFICRDFVAFEKLDDLRKSLGSLNTSTGLTTLNLRYSATEYTSAWREFKCNYMGPVTGCARLVAINSDALGLNGLVNFTEFSLYEDQLVQAVTMSRNITFQSQFFLENLQFVGFRRNLLVLTGKNTLRINRAGNKYYSKSIQLDGIVVTKMVDFFFDEGLGSLLDGYVVFAFKNITLERQTEEFRLLRVTIPYFHIKSYVDLTNMTCDRYLSNCAELEIDFQISGGKSLKKKIYLVDSKFNSVLRRYTGKAAISFDVKSDLTDFDLGRQYLGLFFNPLLTLDQMEFLPKTSLKLTKQPKNAIGKIRQSRLYTVHMSNHRQEDVQQTNIPHAVLMKYNLDGWIRFTLVTRIYKKPTLSSRRILTRAMVVSIPPEQRGGLRIPGSRIIQLDLDKAFEAQELNPNNFEFYPLEISDFGSETASTMLAVSVTHSFSDSGLIEQRNLTLMLVSFIPENSPAKQVLTSSPIVRHISTAGLSIRSLQVYPNGLTGLVMYLQNSDFYSFEVRPDRDNQLSVSDSKVLSLKGLLGPEFATNFTQDQIIDFSCFQSFLMVTFKGSHFGQPANVLGLFNIYRSRESGSPFGIILIEEPEYHIYFHPGSYKIVLFYPGTFRLVEYSLDQDLLKLRQGSKFEPISAMSVLDLRQNEDLKGIISSLHHIPQYESRKNSIHHQSTFSVLTTRSLIILEARSGQSLDSERELKLYLVFEVGSPHSLMLSKLEAVTIGIQAPHFVYSPYVFDEADSELIPLVTLNSAGDAGELLYFFPKLTLSVEYSEFFSDDTSNSTNLRFSISDMSGRQFGDKLIINRTQMFQILSPPSLRSKTNTMLLQTDSLGMVSKVQVGCPREDPDGLYTSRELSSLTCKTNSGTPYDVEFQQSLHYEISLRLDNQQEKQVTELIRVQSAAVNSSKNFFLTNCDDELYFFESIGDRMEFRLIGSLQYIGVHNFSLKDCPKIADTFDSPDSENLYLIMLCSSDEHYLVVIIVLPIAKITQSIQDRSISRTVLTALRVLVVSEAVWDAMVVREEYDIMVHRVYFLRSRVKLADQSSKYIIKVYAFDHSQMEQITGFVLVGTSFNDKYDFGDVKGFAILGESVDQYKAVYKAHLAKFIYNEERNIVEVTISPILFRSDDLRVDFGNPQMTTIATRRRKITWGEIMWTPGLRNSTDAAGLLLVYMLYDDFLYEYIMPLRNLSGQFRLSNRSLNARYRYIGVCDTNGYFRAKVLDSLLSLDCVPYDAESSTNNLIIFKRPDFRSDEGFLPQGIINATHVFSQDVGYDSKNMENLLFKSGDGHLRLLRISPHQVINQYKVLDGLQINLKQKKRSFFQKKKVSLRLSNHFQTKEFLLEFNSEPITDQLSGMLQGRRAPLVVGLIWLLAVTIPFSIEPIRRAFRLLKLKRNKTAKLSYRDLFSQRWDRETQELVDEVLNRPFLHEGSQFDTIDDDLDIGRETVSTNKARRGTGSLTTHIPIQTAKNPLSVQQKHKALMKRVVSDLVV